MTEHTGKIIKGVGGQYEVYVEGAGVITCSAKGILRYRKIRPLIGDNVRIELLDANKKTGNLIAVYPRSNCLIRPAVANVDQALVVFAVKEPEPHLNLLDRFLLWMRKQEVPVCICFNKSDIGQESDAERLAEIYSGCGCPVFFTVATKPETMQELYEALLNKTTVLSGPSGVGKSTIMNFAQPDAAMETGAISEKIKRGKQTTRHSQLFYVTKNTYLCDTPGFSSLYLPEMPPEELSEYYEEFRPYLGTCRFQNCQHIKEPDCAIKEAVAQQRIPKERYDNYKLLHEELSSKRV